MIRLILPFLLLSACDKREVTAPAPSPPTSMDDGLPKPKPRDAAAKRPHGRPHPKSMGKKLVLEDNAFWAAAMMPSEKHLLLADNLNGLRIVGLADARAIKTYPEFFTVTAAAVTPDGKQAVINRLTNDVPSQLLLDLRTGKIERTYHGGRVEMKFVGVMSQGDRIICGGADIRTYARESGKEESRLQLPKDWTACGWALKDGDPLIVTTKRPADQLPVEFAIYDLDLKTNVHTFRGPATQVIESVALLPEEGLIIILHSKLISTFHGLGPPGWRFFLQVRTFSDDSFVWNHDLDYYAAHIVVHPDGTGFYLLGREVHEWKLFD